MAPTVILVHGLWMGEFELSALRHRLTTLGFNAIAFTYPSVRGTMTEHVARLREFAAKQETDALHFVGHSLGGLVVLKMLELTEAWPPGRAVLLGSPVQGCTAARGVARLPFVGGLLGRAVHDEVIDCQPREWSGKREIGVIAGSLGLGLGRLFANLDTDHDGTILVEETKLPGATDHIVLPISHTGMVLSSVVAEQSAYFLQHGKFRHEL
jgi:pimeloyl-ACP methyl ester carboxylesterase